MHQTLSLLIMMIAKPTAYSATFTLRIQAVFIPVCFTHGANIPNAPNGVKGLFVVSATFVAGDPLHPICPTKLLLLNNRATIRQMTYRHHCMP
jgi:hypothetical protein